MSDTVSHNRNRKHPDDAFDYRTSNIDEVKAIAVLYRRYGVTPQEIRIGIYVGWKGMGFGMPPSQCETIVAINEPEIIAVGGTQFPETILTACVGKPILEVIDHPVTRERYGLADVIERAFWDDEAQVTVFEVRRAA